MHAPVVQPFLIQVVHINVIVNLWRSKFEAICNALVAAPLFKNIVEHEVSQVIWHISFISPRKNVFDIRHCGMHGGACGIVVTSRGYAWEQLCGNFTCGGTAFCYGLDVLNHVCLLEQNASKYPIFYDEEKTESTL